MNLHIRWFLRRDMSHVQNIERDSSFQPWTETRYLHALKHQRCLGLVAQRGQNVVGTMIFRKRPHSFEIVRLLVSSNNRHQGIGTQCVNVLKDQLSQQRREEISVILCELNLPAQLFLKSQDFQATALLHNHHPRNQNDAYLMRHRLADIDNSVSILGKSRLAMSFDVEG